jgi:hypothetical protein
MLSNKRFSLLVAALLMGSVPAVASDVVSTINELPAIEIPAKAANAVRAAPAEKQLELSRQILTAVLKERPQMAVQMVATLSRISPDSAPVLAVIASSLVPQYGDVILRAAAASAPEQAHMIAANSVVFFPDSQDLIIKAVSEGAPQSANTVVSLVNSMPQRFTSSPLALTPASGGTISTGKASIKASSPVTSVVNPLTGERQNLTVTGLKQLQEVVKNSSEVSQLEKQTIAIQVLVAETRVNSGVANTDEEEGFGSVAETESFSGQEVVAVDEQRNDPIIKAKLEAAKEEFIDNKYNQ